MYLKFAYLADIHFKLARNQSSASVAGKSAMTPFSMEQNLGSGATGRPIRLAGRELAGRQHCHICAFFSSENEADRILLPFIEEGLVSGEMAVHVVDPDQVSSHRQQLACAGIDVLSAEKSGQLDIRPWTKTHLVDGTFDPVATLARFQSIVEEAATGRFPLVRFVTQMGWAQDDPSMADTLLEYEARANFLWLDQDGPVNPVICTYDLRKFSGAMVIDVMRTHPLIIIGGILQENPFYVPPDDFLNELLRRRSKMAH